MRSHRVVFISCLLLAWLGFMRGADARPVSEKVTERVVETAIESSLEALTQPENQRRLALLLSSTAVTGGVHDIAYALVDGILDGMDGRLAVDGAAFWHGFDTAVRSHVGPAARSITRSAVDTAFATALSEENGVRAEAFAAHVTHGVIKGLAQGIREDLAPALAHAIEHDLAPAGANALEKHIMPAAARGLSQPEMQVAIATTMNAVANSLVRGGDAGIASAKRASGDEGTTGAVKILGDSVSLGFDIVVGVASLLAAVLILIVVLLVRSRRAQTRLISQGDRREAEWLTMVTQLDADESPVDKERLREVARRHAAEEAARASARRRRARAEADRG